MTVLEVLQLCLIGERTGRIECPRDGHVGTLHVAAGRVIKASLANLQGEVAFYALVVPHGAEGQFFPNEEPVERNIAAGTDYLLMEAARRVDESKRAASIKLATTTSTLKLTVSQLTVISDPLPKVFELGADQVRLGRALDNDIILSVESISGHHCKLKKNGRDYHIEDSGSRNGTFVNNKKVLEATLLRPGDLIQLGAALLRCGAGEITPAAIKRKTAKVHQIDTQDLTLPPLGGRSSVATYRAVPGGPESR
jgi:hypothetical protein